MPLSLESNGNQFCGASAIGDYWALTAAHCVDVSTRESETYELRAGTLIKGINGTVHHVRKVIVHHGFNYRHLDNDIALIQVAEPFSKNKYVKYVRLPDQGEITPAGTKAWVAGWGLTKPFRNIKRIFKCVRYGICYHQPELTVDSEADYAGDETLSRFTSANTATELIPSA
uniref:Peptidase S1 domain-containing protein n=1 Tax=Timema douglasi TaxID=61478 RepID=A0A7R8VL42_TIMDO|nr:unnamed protein product [Timema douglasi]